MTADRVTRIDGLDGFSDIETVQAVARVEGNEVRWEYDRTITLKRGDAIENPPGVARDGDKVTLRIIRGYDRMEGGVQA